MPSLGRPTDRKSFSPAHRPFSKSAEEAYKAQWEDVIRWREQERGDLLLALPAANAIATAQQAAHPAAVADDALPLPALARKVTAIDDEISEIAPDPKGAQIAFTTDSVSHRLEDPRHNEIYLVSSSGGEARRLTNNQARESGLRWNAASSQIFFHVGADEGDVENSARSRDGYMWSMPQAVMCNGWAANSKVRLRTSPIWAMAG